MTVSCARLETVVEETVRIDCISFDALFGAPHLIAASQVVATKTSHSNPATSETIPRSAGKPQ